MGNLELADDATVKQLLEALKPATGLDNLTVMYGWPPKTLGTTLGTDEGAASLQSLSLEREALTIVPLETAPAVAEEEPQAAVPDSESSESEAKSKGKGVRDQQITVFMPETNSTLGKLPNLFNYLRILVKPPRLTSLACRSSPSHAR